MFRQESVSLNISQYNISLFVRYQYTLYVK